MPRIVDHEERRGAIIRATWQLIAENGIDQTSMRDIAKAAGYANAGVLSHYFVNKDELLQRAYEHVYRETNARIEAAVSGFTGVEAMLLMAQEIIPLTDVTVKEASIALSFWQRALHNSAMAATSRKTMNTWRRRLRGFVSEAKENHEIDSKFSTDVIVDHVLAVLFGMHVTVLFDAQESTSVRQRAVLRNYFDAITGKSDDSESRF